jgi:hypothetical protein
MIESKDVVLIILVVAAATLTPIVLRLRRRSHAHFLQDYAAREVCEHLRGAMELLRSRGHRVIRAGQKNPQLPLEIHIAPEFSPRELADELKLSEPVFVSDRNVLGCRQDWCELHPRSA